MVPCARSGLAQRSGTCRFPLCIMKFAAFCRTGCTLIPPGIIVYDIPLIVRRPSATLLTAVTPVIRRSPYALLTAVEQ